MLNDFALDIKEKNETQSHKEIAIVGVAFQFPDADNIDKLWKTIIGKKILNRNLSDVRKNDINDFISYTGGHEATFKKMSYIDRIDLFDYEFFDLSYREACLIDPNQRLLLQLAWHAFEDAGYALDFLSQSNTGVFVSYGKPSMYKIMLDEIEKDLAGVSIASNLASIASGRISHYFNLHGPSINIDSACSSSAVCVDMACKCISDGDSEIALVLGSSITYLPVEQKDSMGIEAEDGITRSFDDNASGLSMGEGLVALVLKNADKARKDKDQIYAVISACASNHDGKSNSLTSPNPLAQESVICSAWNKANVDPEKISWIEAHGTGTKIGDLVEIKALSNAFSRYTDKKQFCAISTIKTNMGHTDNISGITGIIKAIAAIKNKQIPPLLNFEKVNRKLDLIQSALYINDTSRYWDTLSDKRICAVSSFGFSGTNCHIVLKEEITKEVELETKSWILTISAKTKKALTRYIELYIEFFHELKEQNNDINIQNICYTSNVRRTVFPFRAAFIGKNVDEFINRLNEYLKNMNSEKMLKCCEHQSAFKIIRQTIAEKNEFKRNAYLLDICNLYIQNKDIDWNYLYKNENCHCVSLPLYPFEPTRCWIKIPDIKKTNSNTNYLSYRRWVYCPRDKNSKYENDDVFSIIFFNKNKDSMKLKEGLSSVLKKSIFVEISEKSQKENSKNYKIDGSEKSFIWLFEELDNTKINKIIYIVYSDQNFIPNILEDNYRNSLCYIFLFIKTLCKFIGSDPISCDLILKNANQVIPGDQVILYDNAAIYGFIKGIYHEKVNITFRCIDIDENTDILNIINEIISISSDYSVAFRKNDRYIEELDILHLERYKQIEEPFKNGGVYVILGGTGNVGIQIAENITQKLTCTLILVGSSDFIDRELWFDETWQGVKKAQVQKIRRIIEKGSNIDYIKANITDESSLHNCFNKIYTTYNKIDGVLHFAKSREKNQVLIEDQTLQNFLEVISIKILSIKLLEPILDEYNVPLLIMASSTITVFGAKKESAYIAANSFLDAYAYNKTNYRRRYLTIGWTTFGENISDNVLFHKGMKSEKMLLLYNEILKRDIPYAIIGEINIDNNFILNQMRLPIKLSYEFQNLIHKCRNTENELIGKKVCIIQGRTDSVYTKTEITICNLLAYFLSLEEISIVDNPIELGLNSLFAVALLAEMEKLGYRISYQDFCENKNIYELCCKIDGIMIKDISCINTEVPMYQSNEAIEEWKYLKGIKPFNELFYKSCFYNSFFSALSFFAIPYDNFLTNEQIYLDKIHDMYTVSYQEIEPFEEIMAASNLSVETLMRSDNIVNDIINEIEKERPVIIWVDAYGLPYRKDTFNIKHLSHTILIIGYSQTAQLFKVIDHSSWMNLNYKEKIVSFSCIQNAYNMFFENFGDKGNIDTFFSFYRSNVPTKNHKNQIDKYKLYRERAELNHKNIIELFESIIDFCQKFNTEPIAFEQVQNIKNLIIEINNIKKVDLYRFKNIICDQRFTLQLKKGVELYQAIQNFLVKIIYAQEINMNHYIKIKRYISLLIDFENIWYDIIIREI